MIKTSKKVWTELGNIEYNCNYYNTKEEFYSVYVQTTDKEVLKYLMEKAEYPKEEIDRWDK